MTRGCPAVPGPGTGTLSVNWGSSYIDFGKHMRSAYRSATNPVDADPNLGFRICRNAAPLDALVQTAAPQCVAMSDSPRVLVAYFSYSGNTRRAAQIISGKLSAPLHEIAMMSMPFMSTRFEILKLRGVIESGFRRPFLPLKPEQLASL